MTRSKRVFLYPDFRLKSFQNFDATHSTMKQRLRFFVIGFYVGSIPTHKTKNEYLKKKDYEYYRNFQK